MKLVSVLAHTLFAAGFHVQISSEKGSATLVFNGTVIKNLCSLIRERAIRC